MRSTARASAGPSDADAERAASTNAAASLESGCSRLQTATTVRDAITPVASSTTCVSARRSSVASRGSTAAPSPAATSPWTPAPVSACRTKFGSTPCVRSCSSTCSARRRVRDERQARELVTRDRPSVTCERSSRLQHDDERIDAESGGVERPLRKRSLCEYEVELSAHERGQERDRRASSRSASPATRRPAATTGTSRASRSGVAPTRRAALPFPSSAARSACAARTRAITASACASMISPAFGQGQRTRSPRPVDQSLTGQILERSDLMADRRLHVAEARGSPPERPLARNRVQGDQVSQLDSRPPFACHFRV